MERGRGFRTAMLTFVFTAACGGPASDARLQPFEGGTSGTATGAGSTRGTTTGAGGGASSSAGGNASSSSGLGGLASGGANFGNTGGNVSTERDAAPGRVDITDGHANPTTDASVDGEAGALPACVRPREQDAGDASTSGCSVGRAYLICIFENGSGAGCVTDERQCPTFGFSVGGSQPYTGPHGCRNVCQPTEYAAGCGLGGPLGSSLPPPSPSCRLVMGGSIGPIYCCPCG
jgi:hypothetical protein